MVDIVVGLVFGDEGKGRCVDYLCYKRLNPARSNSTLVVRFSGGSQAGHNVVIGGQSHIHSNFGSGTMRGVPSYFSKYCAVNPATIMVEWGVLMSKGVVPKLYIDPEAILITPYDVAWNQIGSLEHGTCGQGIGAAMKRHTESPYKLFAADLTNRQVISLKLANILKYYIEQLKSKNSSIEIITRYSELAATHQDAFLRSIEQLFFNKLVSVERLDLKMYDNIIFEGSQGIMLDMDHGFFPNVTFANTTSKNAIALCKEFNLPYHIWYATRCYQTRHGNGPMTSNIPIQLINTEAEINVDNEWQGPFKIAEIDYNLLNYALTVDSIYHTDNLGSLNLLVTCLDQRPEFQFDPKKLNTNFNSIIGSYQPGMCIPGRTNESSNSLIINRLQKTKK